MSGYICKSCRMSMRLALRPQRFHSLSQARAYSTGSLFDVDDMRPMGRDADHQVEESNAVEEGHGGRQDAAPAPKGVIRRAKRPFIDINDLLSKPTWSVSSLLPDRHVPSEDEITPEKLHHLLRLSALPLPKNKDHEAKMLETLHSHLHFVRDIQKVNTDGVEPLRNIRDETEEGIKDITIGMEQLKEAFAKEDVVGKNQRPRRRHGGVVDTKGVEDWDVLGSASETFKMNGARYFVVRRKNDQTGSSSEVGAAKNLDYEERPSGSELEELKVPIDTMFKNK
jgi:Asp-tRNA(Asn)/Glu-tRNA(Gln) amidotransferase C subunit